MTETYQALNHRHKTELNDRVLALDDARDLVRQIKRDIVQIQSRQTAERSAWYAQNAERKANAPKRPVGRPRKDDDTAIDTPQVKLRVDHEGRSLPEGYDRSPTGYTVTPGGIYDTPEFFQQNPTMKRTGEE